MRASAEKSSLIVIDTLAATFGGGDENTSVMVSYINNLAKLRDLHGTTIVTVHHRPKDQTNDTPRGHSSLMGAMDTIIRVDRPDTRMATITKQKDAEPGEPICFNLLNVTLGLDEDGEPVSAAVVEYSKAPISGKLTAGSSAVLQALIVSVAANDGKPVLEKVWREVWETSLPEDTKDETRRKAWTRNRDKLRKQELVECSAGFWMASESQATITVMDFNPAAMVK